MKATVIQNKVDELLAVLDEDTRHIQKSFSWLDELRSLVIKRDDVALSKLLQTIQAESDSYVKNVQQRQALRKDLANALGGEVEQITLSRLAAIVPEGKKAQVTGIKTKLRTLVEQLKKEHLSIALLLSDCARFNNLLLKAIFDLSKTGTVYYSPNGAAKRPPLLLSPESGGAFVSLQL